MVEFVEIKRRLLSFADSGWGRTIARVTYQRYRSRVLCWVRPALRHRLRFVIPRRGIEASTAVAITSKIQAGVVRWPRTPEFSSPNISTVRILPTVWPSTKKKEDILLSRFREPPAFCIIGLVDRWWLAIGYGFRGSRSTIFCPGFPTSGSKERNPWSTSLTFTALSLFVWNNNRTIICSLWTFGASLPPSHASVLYPSVSLFLSDFSRFYFPITMKRTVS